MSAPSERTINPRGDSRRNVLTLAGIGLGKIFATTALETHAADASEQERVVIDSQLDWTLVKPSRLTNSPATQLIRAGPALHVGLLSRISRGDLATFLLNEARDSQHLQERVYVCN